MPELSRGYAYTEWDASTLEAAALMTHPQICTEREAEEQQQKHLFTVGLKLVAAQAQHKHTRALSPLCLDQHHFYACVRSYIYSFDRLQGINKEAASFIRTYCRAEAYWQLYS